MRRILFLSAQSHRLCAAGENTIKDTELLRQFKEDDNLPDHLKNSLLEVIKAFTRDFKNRQSYSL